MNESKAMLGGLSALLVALAVATGIFLYRAPNTAEVTTAKSLVPSRSSVPPPQQPAQSKGVSPKPAIKLGLSIDDPRAYQGYTLIASMASPRTYLIDMKGRVVHRWDGDRPPALSAYLLESGTLLRPGALTGAAHPLNGSGAGGRIQEFGWDGRPVWDYPLADDNRLPHHDVVRVPNGNVLVIAWDRIARDEAAAAGRVELSGQGDFLPDTVLEIKPTGPTSGQVVWQWRVWDHLIQDRDPAKPNFGDIAKHPERIDVNFGESPMPTMTAQRDGVAKLRSLGYVGANTGKKAPRLNADWTHVNAVDYNSALDQIMLTVHGFSEIWVIDHSTTTAEAAGRSGGRAGKGGDLLFRWGNPRAHRAGRLEDQRLYFPHSAHWIARGLPGEGHVLVFNNGARRPGGPFSSVDEVVFPAVAPGTDQPARTVPELAWRYTAPRSTEFYSMLLSGAQRLPNGNTLICSGMSGTVFEVTPNNELVWQYTCPVPGGASGSPGFGPSGGSALFRAYRYGPDFPGLAGKELKPGPTIEEQEQKTAGR
jgi:hypothetical protein